jgi:hypothetical protein
VPHPRTAAGEVGSTSGTTCVVEVLQYFLDAIVDDPTCDVVADDACTNSISIEKSGIAEGRSFHRRMN